jgi:hypothetical protein
MTDAFIAAGVLQAFTYLQVNFGHDGCVYRR